MKKVEIEKMKNEAKANEEADKAVRERVEKLNMADGLIFNSEKQLKDNADKIPADKKEAIEKALQALKDAHKAEDLAGIDAAMETLNTAWSAASEHMYAGNPQEGAATEGAANEKQDDNVADAEFEEVK